MEKIVITGAGGYVGRSFVERMKDEAVQLVCLTRSEVTAEANNHVIAEANNQAVAEANNHLTAAANNKSLNTKAKNETVRGISGTVSESVAGRVTWIATDYSAESLNSIFEGADAVVHLASTKGDKTDIEDFRGDRAMLDNILSAMSGQRVRRIVFTSSRLVYGNPDNVPWAEDTAREPGSAYGISKCRCEDECRRAAAEYGFDCAIVRVAQVVGIGEGVRNMMNVFQDKALAGEQLTVIGESRARRQYIYNRDLAEILCRLTLNDYGSDVVVNAGMDKAYTNYEIAELINAAYGNETQINYDDSKPETITPSIMKTDVLNNVIGFVPRRMDEALAEIAAERKEKM